MAENEPGQEPIKPNNDTPPTEPTPQSDDGQKTFDETYVKELRAEAAKNRKALRDAQAQLDEIRQAQEADETQRLAQQGEYKKLAEQEAAKRAALEKQLADQERALAGERRDRLAISVATTLGAIDPTDANFTAAVAGIDPNEDGAQDAIRQALETLKERRPYLFGQHRQGLAPFNPSGQDQGPPRETDAQRRMRLYSGGGQSIFDASGATEHGGGVIWPKGKPD